LLDSIDSVVSGESRYYVGQSDCLEMLDMIPSGCADVLLTDPPYCSGGHLESQKNAPPQGRKTQFRNKPGFKWFVSDNMSTGGLVWLLRSVMCEANRFLKPNRAAFMFTDFRMVPHLAPALESSGLRFRNLLVWDKGYPGLGTGFKPTHEMILEYANGTTEYASKTGSNVLRHARVHPNKKEHNAEKPVELLTAILAATIKPGDLVIDPFSGSGSTGVAALRAGARFIGFERDPEYAQASRARLASELDLLARPAA
jgi:DNA modification methylase